VLALRWSDVDPKAGTLRIERAPSDGEFVAPKTPRSRRKIELSNTARTVLRGGPQSPPQAQARGADAKSRALEDHGLVFPSTVGTLLSHRTPSQRRALAFKALLKRAGLPACRHPTLRPPPYLRDTATQQQRPSQVRLGTSGTRFHSADAGHLQPRTEGHGRRDRRRDGRHSRVELALLLTLFARWDCERATASICSA